MNASEEGKAATAFSKHTDLRYKDTKLAQKLQCKRERERGSSSREEKAYNFASVAPPLVWLVPRVNGLL